MQRLTRFHLHNVRKFSSVMVSPPPIQTILGSNNEKVISNQKFQLHVNLVPTEQHQSPQHTYQPQHGNRWHNEQSIVNLTDKDLEIEKKFPFTKETFEICRHLAESCKQKEMVDIYYDTPSFSLTRNDHWLRQRNAEFELKVPKVSLKDQLKARHSGDRCNDGIDQYFEILNERKIVKKMNALFISLGKRRCHDVDLESFLTNHQVLPFGVINSKRTRFELTLPLFADFQRLTSSSIANHLSSLNGDWKISFFVDFDNVTYVNPEEDCDSFLSCHEYQMNPSSQSLSHYQIAEIELCSHSNNLREIPLSLQNIFEQISFQLKISSLSTPQASAIRGKVLEYLFRFQPNHYQELKNCGQLASKGIH